MFIMILYVDVRSRLTAAPVKQLAFTISLTVFEKTEPFFNKTHSKH